jgi:hypothetical protein
VLVCDRAGLPRHENGALGRLLADDVDGPRVREAARALAREAGVLLRRPDGTAVPSRPGLEQHVRTRARTYQLRAALAAEGALGGEPLVMITVERARDGAAAPLQASPPAASSATHPAADDAALRERFGLTAQELHVARLMAGRRTDAEIGTAPRHLPAHRAHARRARAAQARRHAAHRRRRHASRDGRCGAGARAWREHVVTPA